MADNVTDAGTQSLEDLAHEIGVRVNKADDHVITAALQLHELRTRIERGEVGVSVNWLDWAKEHTGLSKARLYELQNIAEAKDPKAELDSTREKVKARVQKHREASKGATKQLEPVRLTVIEWAKTAPIGDVQRILLYIEGVDQNREHVAVSNPANDDVRNAA